MSVVGEEDHCIDFVGRGVTEDFVVTCSGFKFPPKFLPIDACLTRLGSCVKITPA